MFFFYKNINEAIEYKVLEEYKNNICLLLGDNYISRKDYISLYDANKEIYEKLSMMDNELVLKSWCKNTKTDFHKLKSLMEFYTNTKILIDNHNNKFVYNHMHLDKKYLDEILLKDDPNIQLDEDQRKVVLSDEDYTLVIAGAGAGKTTTIEAKVKYLIDRKHVAPSKILIVSYTRKATKELRDRCKKLGLPVVISTFHSIANTIIKSTEEEKHNVATGDVMFNSIKKYLLENANDEEFIKKILLFFASYLQVPPGENDLALLIKELNKNDCSTMKYDIERTIENLKKQQENNRKTIKEEKVRSVEECRIANFLFINGLDYDYEPIYKYGFKDSIKPYRPDFLIKQFDKEIYLEHFGISEDGKNPRFSDEELEIYKKHVNDKILLHKQHGTKLIYTFSKYKDGRDTITHLKEELQKAGISFEFKNSKEVYKVIIQNIEDKYFYKFIQLVCVFISRFKTNNFTPSKFDEWKISLKDERTKLFINICYQCYLAYMTELKRTNSIDFEDMINNASNILENKIRNDEKLPYDYIFVDEYQDISLQRFDLCEKLSKCSNAKIIAVGDDWQSIFRFSGAKVELFTKFEKIMGYANILKINKTYRNSQELIDIAGGFVMANDKQIKKELKSNKSISEPVLLMSYNDKYDRGDTDRPIDRMCQAIEKSLDMIVKTNGKKGSVLLIGRYGFEGIQLGNQHKYFTFNNGIIKSIKYPELIITYLTAHSSKGLGYDNVIIINGKDAILGFPSKIVDDPIMKLVIKDNENIEYAEERRLFYVALTRTKNRVFIITPVHRPSKFILEIKDKFKTVILDGEELNPEEKLNNMIKCPCCGYPLQKRINRHFFVAKKLWVCSNDPEICGFVTNDLLGGKMSISKCPNCKDGYLVVKRSKNNPDQRILGCTNYKADGTGCNTIMIPRNYTQDKEELKIRFCDEKIDINNVFICGHKLIELVNVILEVLDRYKNLELSLGPKILFSLLSGERTKMINNYELYNDPRFGFLNVEDKRKFYLVFSALKDAKIIDVNEANFSRTTVLKSNLNEEEYKVIFGLMKL